MLLAGLVAAVFFLSRPQGQPAPEKLDKPVMATQIEFMADAMQRSAARIAAHPQTLACFASAAPDVCQAQAANLHALNQDATVLFVTDGQRQLLPGFLPGDTRRLLANAGRGGVGSTATATFNLSLSHPVAGADGKRLGFVIVEQSVPQLQALFDTLPLPDASAYAELQQSQGDGTVSVLMRRGNQAIKKRSQPYWNRADRHALDDRGVAPGHPGGGKRGALCAGLFGRSRRRRASAVPGRGPWSCAPGRDSKAPRSTLLRPPGHLPSG